MGSAGHRQSMAVHSVGWCQPVPTGVTEALLMCRDHILNIKDAPAPKPAGKGAKRTLEQATAAPPATAAASAQPAQEASAAAQTPAETPAETPAVEGEQPSDGQDIKEQPAAQEQTLLDAAELQLPGLSQESAQAGTSEPQDDGNAAASTVTVSVIFSRYVELWLRGHVLAPSGCMLFCSMQ